MVQNPTFSHVIVAKWFKRETVMAYFPGKQIHSIDAKGRIIVPVKYRKELGESFVVAWMGECLNLYPVKEWENLMYKLDEQLPADESGIIEYFSYYSEQVDMDSQGRAMLPQDLRMKAGIEKDIISVGDVGKIHVYAKDAWEKKFGDRTMQETRAGAASRGVRV